MLLTAGGAGIWIMIDLIMIDLIMIATGNFTDSEGLTIKAG